MQHNNNGQPINIGIPFDNFAEHLKNAQDIESELRHESVGVTRALKRTAKWNMYANFVLTNVNRVFGLNFESILKTFTNAGIKIVFAYIAYKEVMQSIEDHVLKTILDIIEKYYKAENDTNLVYLLATLVMLSYIFSYYGYKRKALETDKQAK